MKITLEPGPMTKIKTVSDLRRLLARTLSKIPGDMRVTKFSVSVSLQKDGFRQGD